MKRLILIILLTALALTACATESSLWGIQSTPTARIPTATLPASQTPTVKPTEPSVPTGTFTLTPTLPSPTQTLVQVFTPNPQDQPILYYAQSGDSLAAVAARFGVEVQEITSPKNLPASGLLDSGTLLIVPDRIETETTPIVMVMPDSEVVFSASATDFDVVNFIKQAGGYLSTYQQYLGTTGKTTGAEGMARLTRENSVNPRLMLALLEYEGGWVYGTPTDMLREKYALGYQSQKYEGLFMQLVWGVNQLFAGYYGWRIGTLTELTFPNGETLRIAPTLNAGTVAIQYFFSRQHNRAEWERILDPDSESGFPAYYLEMFGNPWTRSRAVEPIFPPGLVQPTLILPFEPNDQWNLTSGPHGAWEPSEPLAAIDFAPASDHKGCDVSTLWVVAAASGLVVRSDNGVVMLDLDGDGNEQTGWDLLYLHMADEGRVMAGTWVKTGDRIGHASCEGGISTGRHLHFARKYNGEWIIADSALPFNLSGWTVHLGAKPYQGTLTRGESIVTADPFGQAWSVIIRLPNE
jgi:murein DD-endopeptidase MepM/ murein hydrolase activator NlpD